MFLVRTDQAKLLLTPDLLARDVWEASKAGRSDPRRLGKTQRFSPVEDLVVALYSTASGAEVG